jgi:hypothetical protein
MAHAELWQDHLLLPWRLTLVFVSNGRIGVGWYGDVFHTIIARSAYARL